ncbi:MAG: HD domain-containing protein [Nitrososphaerales archaeon]|jgi:putative hydrolase of HD superfamily|nr:HD domain-containing protein [Nitrososphaerales archaeon]
MKDIINFLFEMGILAKTPRSGFHYLGTGSQSVAEHVNRVAFIGYSLASACEGIDVNKVLKMCLFHDMAETRTSDPNYVHQKYVETKEHKAVQDMTCKLPFGEDIREIIREYEERITTESLIAKDADNLELMLSLKEQLDIGNKNAKDWLDLAIQRLKTEVGKKAAKMIMETSSDEWWFGDRKSDWWINRGKA